MSIPCDALPVPDLVARLAAGRPTRVVWGNQIGGTTWRIEGASPELDEYVKLGPAHDEFVPADEAARSDWTGRWLPTPSTIAHGEADGLRWLHTRALCGRCAVDPLFTQNSAMVPAAVAALGRALRTLHDRLPVDQCPWQWSVDNRLARLSPEAREALGPAPELGDDLVVCHGDACNPNFQLAPLDPNFQLAPLDPNFQLAPLDPNFQLAPLDPSTSELTCVGWLDLGNLGIADRHADLAPALLSLGWNFGGIGFDESPSGYVAKPLDEVFLAAYGADVDVAKLDFYTRLWNAG